MTAILERVTVGRCFARASNHPGGVPDAIRLMPPSDVSEGYEDVFPQHDDLLITSKQIAARGAFEDHEPGLGRLVFLFHLHGRRTVEVKGAGRHDLNLPKFVAYYHAEGVVKTSFWSQGDTETSILVGFSPQKPPPVVNSALRANSDARALISKPNCPCFWLEFPLTLEMERAARQVSAANIHPAIMREFLLAKADELLCLGSDALLASFTRSSDQSAAERIKLDLVVKIIDEDFRTTPTVGFLAERVDVQPAVLSSLFLDRFGFTISEYCARKRMDMANRLLATTNMPLKQVAYEVGYNHISNFNLAFRKTFGVTPRQAR